MLLVPRQLQRHGMTGNVAYYGGRLSPAQAYAASHPAPTPLPPEKAELLRAVQHLFDTGVLTPEEYEQYSARVVS